MKKIGKTILLATMIVVAAACGSTNDADVDATPESMASASALGALSAPDIAGILTVANTGEVQQAQAALPHLTTQAARDFANMMITDHTNALNEARATFSASNIVPRESNLHATTLRDESQRVVSSLNAAASGADQMYMQAQVDAHQNLLSMIDSHLIPSASGELLTLLQTQRTGVAAHLDRAKQIVATPLAQQSIHDRMFADTMIRHHENGIRFARLAVEKAQNAELRALAQKMIDDQNREIAQLRALRGEGPQTTTDEMSTLPGTIAESTTQSDLARLEAAQGREFDIAFTEIMAKHHESGTTLAQHELHHGSNAELKQLAQQIFDHQTTERQQLLALNDRFEQELPAMTSAAPDRQRLTKD